MERPYIMPTSTETSDLFQIMKYVNNTVGGWFMPSILLVIYITIFAATKRFSNVNAFLTASFICALLSIPLVILELLNPMYMYLLFFMTAIGVVWAKLTV